MIPPLRLALAQINTRVGRHRGQRRQDHRGHRARPRRRRRAGPVPRARASPATRPRTCCSRSTSSLAASEAVAELATEAQGIVALVGFPERADDVHNALAVLAEGELKAVYRKTVLPNYGVFDEQRYFQVGDGGARARARRRAARPDDLRGHLDARPARVRRGAGRRAADPQRVRLAVPRRQGRRARADADPARARQPRRRRVLQPRRRPGRAGLRRPFAADRPRGHGARPRAAVRRGADRRDGRPAGGDDRAAARHAAAQAGPPGAARGAPDRPAGAPRGHRATTPRAATSRRCSSPRPRSTPRSCSARATTSRRTASGTS